MKFVLLISSFGLIHPFADSACLDFPSVFDGNWYDSQFHETSTKGMITFSQSDKKVSTGWSITAYGETKTDFTCVLSSSGLLVFQSTDTVHAFGADYYVLLCISITKKTDYSYMYYRRGGIINGIRVSVLADSEVMSTSTSSYCTGTANTEDFGVLVQDGQYSNAAVNLPDPFLGIYNYTFTSDGSNYRCAGTSLLDGCTDKTLVQLNTSLCNDELLDTDNGQFHVVAHVLSGSTYYISAMRSDSIVTHRSTCVAATISGTSVTASTDPGSCFVGQSSSSRTTHSDSVLITMVPYDICYSTDSTVIPIPVVSIIFISSMITLEVNNYQ